MKVQHLLFVILCFVFSNLLFAQADPYPVKDCIGKDGNPELYKISKMKEGDVLSGIWYDSFAGTPGDSVAWASSFYKLPKIESNYSPTKPKDFGKLKEWAKDTCGYYTPYGVQYNEQDEACLDLSKNKGIGEVILSPITLEEKHFYFQLTFQSKKFPIDRVFKTTSLPKKVRFYFLIPEELTGGARGGKEFKNLKLIASQEAEIPFKEGYLKVPIQSYDKIRSQFKVDRKKIYHDNIIVATEILEIYESKGTPGEIGRTCIDEISNTLGEKYYQRKLMKP
ncbi:hypothetical protein ACSYG2_02605 [Leptospira interrogans serovar Icterohaemorrhagiae]|uniref:hypothetical protein n=1 Tax=Leptospira interrogans TaxID=173 RepID=UPI0002BA18C7|nr:hypothetical protein [Leptospira interrogans]QOI33237.1 hypothetical protein LeptoLang_02650 [Leptospira interrogans serovar Icterohaemorrhagiae]QOI33253.1 hypothetical protein LeptoLang_02745 [Leptospira interrogans serovar Icterohaemorrhagiae]QOI35563.1 hypothetical protein LeptoLang_15960 [Leptospira interrogans serovar Icterohaemorrhagiae]